MIGRREIYSQSHHLSEVIRSEQSFHNSSDTKQSDVTGMSADVIFEADFCNNRRYEAIESYPK